MIELILFLTIAFPIAWLISEFQPRRWLRLVLGCCAIAMTFGVAWIAGSLQAISYNTSYGDASKELVDKTLQELESGNQSDVIGNLQWFQSRYFPNYETGLVDYERLVASYIERFDDSGKPAEATDGR